MFPAPVVKLPPNVIVLPSLFTPVPPLAPGRTPVTCEVKLIVPERSAVLKVVQAGAEPPVDFNTWPAVPTPVNEVVPAVD